MYEIPTDRALSIDYSKVGKEDAVQAILKKLNNGWLVLDDYYKRQTTNYKPAIAYLHEPNEELRKKK